MTNLPEQCPDMLFTTFDIIIDYEKYEHYTDGEIELIDRKDTDHKLIIQESKKSYNTSQSSFISDEAKAALDAFLELEKGRYSHLGYNIAEDYEIEFIDGCGGYDLC